MHNTPQWQIENRFLDIFRNLIYISIPTLWYKTRNWAQVQPVSMDHPWDVSTTWLESPCGQFSWLDMIWKGTHIYMRSHSWQCVTEPSHQGQRNCPKSSETGLGRGTDLGKGTNTFMQHWRSPTTQWPPSSLKGRRLEPPRLFLVLAARANWAIAGEGPWTGRWPGS